MVAKHENEKVNQRDFDSLKEKVLHENFAVPLKEFREFKFQVLSKVSFLDSETSKMSDKQTNQANV